MSGMLALIGMPIGWEWVIILVVFMAVFGAGKLPEVAKQLGKGVKSFKKEMRGDALDVTESTEELPSATDGEA